MTTERHPRHDPGISRTPSDNGRPDPLLELLARMIRHAHDSGRRPGRGTLTVMQGGRTDER